MGIADEVEEWLRVQTNFVNQDHAPEQITEWGRVKYRPDRRWYRKCHRCDFWQPCIRVEDHQTQTSVEYFPETSHMCIRDGFLKDIRWRQFW